MRTSENRNVEDILDSILSSRAKLTREERESDDIMLLRKATIDNEVQKAIQWQTRYGNKRTPDAEISHIYTFFLPASWIKTYETKSGKAVETPLPNYSELISAHKSDRSLKNMKYRNNRDAWKLSDDEHMVNDIASSTRNKYYESLHGVLDSLIGGDVNAATLSLSECLTFKARKLLEGVVSDNDKRSPDLKPKDIRDDFEVDHGHE